MGLKDALKNLEQSAKDLKPLPKESKLLREENKRLKKLFSKFLEKPTKKGAVKTIINAISNISKKADGGEIKIKEKPLSPRQQALVDSANRIRKLEAAEERTKGITPKVKPKKPIVPKKKPINSKAIAKKYFTGVF